MAPELLDFIREAVIPDLVGRISRDNRVTSVELVSDFGFSSEAFGSNKVVAVRHVINTSLDANSVVSELIRIRKATSDVVLQYNPLFPFVSVDSMWKAYFAVQQGTAVSATGSFVDRASGGDVVAVKEHDLGIVNAYSVDNFRENGERITLPTRVIGLNALELIGLRNPKDLGIFELVRNSGFEA